MILRLRNRLDIGGRLGLAIGLERGETGTRVSELVAVLKVRIELKELKLLSVSEECPDGIPPPPPPPRGTVKQFSRGIRRSSVQDSPGMVLKVMAADPLVDELLDMPVLVVIVIAAVV